MVINPNLLQQATIRNARVCTSTENYGLFVDFNREFDTQGWTGDDVSIFGSSGGFLFMTATTPTPNIFHATGFSPVDASINTQVLLRYKYVRNRSDSTAVVGKVQFQTTNDVIWDEEKELEFEVDPDGKWHRYVINFGPVSTWVGLISNLRVFFATDGQAGDEIFITDIKIQANTFNFCIGNCLDEQSNTIVGQFFDIETIGNIPANWALAFVDTSRRVFVDVDPEFRSSDSKVARLLSTDASTPGPRMSRGVPNHTEGYFSCRLRTSSTGAGTVHAGRVRSVKDTVSDLPVWEIGFENDGRIKRRLNSSTMVDFAEPLSYSPNTWYDLLIVYDTLLGSYDVYINGALVAADLPVVFTGLCAGLVVEHGGGVAYDYYIDDILVVESQELNRLCPGMGKQGYVEGQQVDFDYINVVRDINDTLVVNIDDYGDVVIKLTEEGIFDPLRLRFLLERAISNIDSGGYPYAEVDFEDGHFVIRSGSYDFSSQVVVKKHGTSNLSDLLGFTADGEISPATSQAGRPHAKGFQFLNNYRATSYDLTSLAIDEDDTNPIVQVPSKKSISIGQDNAGFVGTAVKYDGSNQTIIDFFNRATADGRLSKVQLHGNVPTSTQSIATGSEGQANGNLFDTGVQDLGSLFIRNKQTPKQDKSLIDGAILIIDEPGYEGNGEYAIESLTSVSSSFEFTSSTKAIVKLKESVDLPQGSDLNWDIIVTCKLKQFRPNFDGSLTLVNEASIGLEDQGVLYTNSHSFYEMDIDWNVKRGDLIGIYNAIDLFVGNNVLQIPDATFISEEGDLFGDSIEVSPPDGEGIEGIGLYGFGDTTQALAIYDIDFGSAISLEAFELKGQETIEDLDYNILAAVGLGVGVSVNTHGQTHNHAPVRGSTGLAEIQTHPNIAYNIFALTDGIQFSRNGIIGTFESDDSRASYFYVDGDGEWIEIEFPEPTWIAGTGDAYNFEDDPITLGFSWGYNKTIHRLRTFFKEFPNFMGYQLEYLADPSLTYDGSTQGFKLLGGFEDDDIKFETVALDDKLYEYDIVVAASGANATDTHVHLKHFAKKYDVHYKHSSMTIEEKRKFDVALYHPFKIIDKTWEPISTKGLNLYSFYHYSTKISEIELFSTTSSETDLRDIVDLYYSYDGEYFHAADPIQTEDDIVRYVIGNPVRYIRLIASPFSTFTIDRLKAIPDADLVQVYDADINRPTRIIDTGLYKGTESPPKQMKLINKTGSDADLALSVETKEITSSTVLKTSLNSEEDIREPEVGPPGHIFLDEDFDLPVVDNVAMNGECYGLKNLAVGQKYYIMDRVITESDLFVNNIDNSKWEMFNVNFPQTAPAREVTYLSFPGFQMIGDPPGEVDPVGSMRSTLKSRWYTSSSFTATINCQYDAGGADTDDFGSEIGIIDQTGRTISLRRSRVWYTTDPDPYYWRSWADYIIEDSLTGVIEEKRIFCESQCGTETGEEDDSDQEYDLRIQYISTNSNQIMRFYFKDSLNFDGIYQWGGAYDPLDPDADLGFDLDLSSLAQPLQGPFKVFIANRWEASTEDAAGTPTSSDGTYIRVNWFKFEGDSSYGSIVEASSSYNFVGSLGEINITNVVANPATEPVRMVALDLGRRYALDNDLLRIFISDASQTSLSLWDLGNTLYSSSDVSDPEQVSWGDGGITNARWLLFQQPTTSSVPSAKYLHSVRVYPNLSIFPPGLLTNSKWDYLGKILTNGDFTTTISQIEYPVISIGLPNQFNIKNYKLLSRSGQEYQSYALRAADFNGWEDSADNFFQTQGFTLTADPTAVIWRGWSTYPNSTVDNKEANGVKWFAFKNSLLNTTNPYSQEQRAAQFEASTFGILRTGAGQATDRVDFTEYAEWFDVSLKRYNEVAGIEIEELDADGHLYGSSEEYHPAYGYGDPPLGPASIFDGPGTTDLLLKTSSLPVHFYRVFGTLSGSIDATTVTGIDLSGLPEDSGSEDGTVTGVDYTVIIEPVTVSYLEVEMADNTSAVPKDLDLQMLIAEDPETDANWSTVSGGTYTDIEEAFGTFTNDPATGLVSFTTGGKFFRHNFDPPLLVSGLRVLISDFEDVGGNYLVANIAEFRVYEEIPHDTTNLLVIENDEEVRHRGRRSLKLTYQAGGAALKVARVPRSFNLLPDAKWSPQDHLSFYMRLDGSSSMDLDESYIRLGKDPDDYYEWGFDQISTITQGEMVQCKLRFRDARYKGGDPDLYERTAELSDLESQTDFRAGNLTYFEIGLAPKGSEAVSDIKVWLDDFTIERENFTLPGKSNDTLYLTNSELVYFPLTGFDMRKGYIEFTITPDWDSEGSVESPDESEYGDRVYTIFSVINGADEYMGMYYTNREQEGLRFVVNTPDSKLDLIVGQIVKLERYTQHLKVGLLWDSEGARIDARSGATVRLYLDDGLIGDMILPWEISETKDTYFLIGSKAYSQAASSRNRQFREFGFNIEVRPVVRSLNGGIEDLLILSDPVKFDYDEVKMLKDKILISLDGITYYPGNSPNLPLEVLNVPNNGEVTFYLKTNFPEDTDNMSREGYVKARWLKSR